MNHMTVTLCDLFALSVLLLVDGSNNDIPTVVYLADILDAHVYRFEEVFGELGARWTVSVLLLDSVYVAVELLAVEPVDDFYCLAAEGTLPGRNEGGVSVCGLGLFS